MTLALNYRRIIRWLTASLLVALSVAGCSSDAEPENVSDVGSNPQLSEPDTSLLPVVNIAPARGWPKDTKPIAAPGLKVNAFARDLDHPRWIYTLPNGDVLVAESNSPRSVEGFKGIKGWVAKRVVKKAGGAVPSANRITLLRDADDDGVAEFSSVLLKDLYSPFGMTLIGDELYVANTDAIVKFPYTTGITEIKSPGVKVADLPAGEINHHWTKNIIASADQRVLYATVGSNSNIGENGMAQETNRAAILKVDLATGQTSLFASGLRNPNGLAFDPESGMLWTTVNERDELGNNLVPDYMTSVQEGAFYGWPYSYYGQNVDTRVSPQRPDLVAQALSPDYALGSHVAALGLTFYTHTLLPRYRNGAIIGLHGSWNRKPHSGYKVIYVPFKNGKPSGKPQDVLTGFLDAEGNAQGRPVGVVTANDGAVLVADDVGNVIWRIASSASSQ